MAHRIRGLSMHLLMVVWDPFEALFALIQNVVCIKC